MEDRKAQAAANSREESFPEGPEHSSIQVPTTAALGSSDDAKRDQSVSPMSTLGVPSPDSAPHSSVGILFSTKLDPTVKGKMGLNEQRTSIPISHDHSERNLNKTETSITNMPNPPERRDESPDSFLTFTWRAMADLQGFLLPPLPPESSTELDVARSPEDRSSVPKPESNLSNRSALPRGVVS